MLRDRVVFITGASRGVGRACALACARAGAHVVVAAKTIEPDPRLPGTVGETVAAVEALGRRALGIALDVRDADLCARAVEQTVSTFGRLDVLVNNAGALWWADVTQTPMKRFDLIMGINVRASFALSHAALPHMVKAGFGHVVTMSPPVELGAVAHHAAYAVSKFGMTMLALAIAAEHAEHNVTGNALWPATLIESQATIGNHLGEPRHWRKADILADALVAIVSREPRSRPGRAWIDEDVLRAEGVTDFSRYQCVPGSEPMRLGFADIPPISAGR
jgi:citronellol/citronellal dehydrogenase